MGRRKNSESKDKVKPDRFHFEASYPPPGAVVEGEWDKLREQRKGPSPEQIRAKTSGRSRESA
jgi:hypothetical protein